jgi:TonB-linked SusC/RagA family outer membrane protein
MYKIYTHFFCTPQGYINKILLVMRLTTVLLLATFLHVSATGLAQNINFKQKNASFEQIVKEIRLQTGYNVLVSSNKIKSIGPQDVNFRNTPLLEVLRTALKDQALTFEIDDRTVLIKEKTPSFLDKVVDAFIPPIDVRGTVLDENGMPLAGVTVRVKGTNKATSTGNDGKFYLAGVDDDAVLEFRMVGYKTLELSAKGKFDGLRMEQITNNLDETIVVAYGTTTQRNSLGAITVIKGEQIASLPNTSFDRSLQGLVPGLQISKGTGQPGAGLSNMVLRGISTGSDVSFGSTVRNPLIVIDGVPVSQENFQFVVGTNETPVTNPMAQLNPSDIESISVLKDAVAIALYGSKASNGVILVTTKKGKAGKTIVGFRHQTDINTRLLGKVEVLDQQDYLKLIYDTYKTTNSALWTDDAILADLKSKFPVRSDGSFYPQESLFDALFSNGHTSSNNLSVSGGNDKTNFYLNLESNDQEGIVKKSGYNRKSIRFNSEHRLASWFKLGFNSTFSYNTQEMGNGSESTLLVYSPLLPIRREDGSYQLTYTQGFASESGNPVAMTEFNYSRNISNRGLSNLSAEARFLKYLTFTSNFGIDFMLAESKGKSDPRFANITPPSLSEQSVRRNGLINTNMLRFDKIFGERHTLGLLAGQETQVNTDKRFTISAAGTAATLPYYDQVNSPGYTISSSTVVPSKQTLLSFFGQLNYNYDDRYLLNSGVRRDASSKFGDQSQWGTYWSAGAGWIASNESFMSGAKGWLNFLKFRGSLGIAGNSGAISNLLRYDLLSAIKYGNISGVQVSVSSLGNPDIRWEKTFNWNAGLEMRFLKQRLSITADIYSKKTTDLIYVTNLPTIAGYTAVLSNIGDINNKGVELVVAGTIIDKKSFRWNMSANWSTNENILVKANVPLSTISGGTLANEEGRNFNSFYMPVWAGVNPIDGKPQWLDNAGNPTSTSGQAKKEFVGKPQPDGFGSIFQNFSYKGFDLSAQFYYQYGNTIYDASYSSLMNDGNIPYVNQLKSALGYWKAPGDVAVNPIRRLGNTDRGSIVSTRYLAQGDYLRFSNLLIGYNLQGRILEHLRISKLRLYAQVNNVAILTNFSGPDPDIISVGGSTKLGYPNERTYSLGLNVNFQ